MISLLMLVERQREGGRGVGMATEEGETGAVSSSDMRYVLKYRYPCVAGVILLSSPLLIVLHWQKFIHLPPFPLL